MKKVLFILSCVMISCITLQSCKQSDQQLKSEVDKVLMNGYTTITSSVKDGIATLTGTVDSEQQKMAAENVVRAVKNVKSVVNNITVKQAITAPQTSANSDAATMSTITSRLNTEGFKDVRVDVVNGEVILSGDLNRSDLNKVMQIANDSNPMKVTNRLNLK